MTATPTDTTRRMSPRHFRTLIPSASAVLAAGVLVTGGLATAAPAFAAPPGPDASSAATPRQAPAVGALRTVRRYDFSQGQTPENIAFAADGTRYVTLAFGGLLEIAPPGAPARVLRFPGAGAGSVVGGVVVTRSGIYTTLSSPDPALAGIWLVGPDDRLTRFAALPAEGAHNGLAVDARGALYVADSVLGRVYRVPTRGSAAGRARVWLDDDRLDPVPGQELEGIAFPGANGVKVFGGALYVANSAQGNVLRARIRADGRPDELEVAYPGVVADDFAFDVRGNLYTSTDPFQTVERIAPDGTRTVLATAADGLDGPSAVAFGVPANGHGERTTLYVTQLGLFGTRHQPQLSALDVGIPGAPLGS